MSIWTPEMLCFCPVFWKGFECVLWSASHYGALQRHVVKELFCCYRRRHWLSRSIGYLMLLHQNLRVIIPIDTIGSELAVQIQVWCRTMLTNWIYFTHVPLHPPPPCSLPATLFFCPLTLRKMAGFCKITLFAASTVKGGSLMQGYYRSYLLKVSRLVFCRHAC